MKITDKSRTTAKVLPFPPPFRGVNQTDRKHRLPTLSSAEIECFFDSALERNSTLARAA